jgi:hypothetical protein
MKRKLSIVLIMCIFVSLIAGCTGGNDGKIVIGIIQYWTISHWIQPARDSSRLSKTTAIL